MHRVRGKILQPGGASVLGPGLRRKRLWERALPDAVLSPKS